MLCYEFPPLGGGGANVVYGLSKELVRNGHGVDLVTMGFRGLPEHEIVNGTQVYRVRSRRRKLHVCTAPEAASYVAKALPVLRRLLEQNRYDINHTHFIFPDGFLAWSIQRFAKLPYVITAHGSDVPGYNPHRLKLVHKILSPLWKAVTRNASRIVCPSESLRALVAARNAETDITMIPNGISTERFRPDREKLERILVVTRMLERKGVQYFLRALESVSPNQEVHIVGDGPYLPALRRLATAIAPHVKFWGWMDNRSPEFTELFETSGIFVFPSEAENFPIVLLEAMAAGMAIITTEGTGCAEVVGDAALLIPPKDPPAIRKALSLLVRKPELRRALGQAARKRLVERFSWSSVEAQYAALYREVGIQAHLSRGDSFPHGV